MNFLKCLLGSYYDKERDSIYLRKRYYNSALGRFTTEDPAKDGLNWYAYCGNNPVMFIDLTGKLKESDGKYDYSTQLELLRLTKKYNEAKLNGNQTDMFNAHKQAEQIRENAKERGILDLDASYFNLHLACAYELAETNGFKEGTNEFSIFIETYMEEAVKSIREVDSKSSQRFILVALASVSNYINGEMCFTEETKVIVKNGTKKIKDIKLGDEVLSFNEETGEIGYKKVKNIFIRETRTLVHIKVDEVIINTTEEHPFYVKDAGWVKAKYLKEGDLLRIADGNTKRINNIEIENTEKPVTVYNFEVEDWHTYFVSNFDILVHNNCGIPEFIKNDRVPNDSETVLSNGTFKKTNRFAYGDARIYEKDGKYYYRDTFHTGEAAHLEVFNKRGNHLGEANPLSGELMPGTADSSKRLRLK